MVLPEDSAPSASLDHRVGLGRAFAPPQRRRRHSEACRGLRSAPQPTPKTGIVCCPLAGEGTALDEFHCTDSVADVAGWLKQETDARVAAGAPRKAHVMPLGAMLAAWVTANPLLPLEQAVAQLSVSSQ